MAARETRTASSITAYAGSPRGNLEPREKRDTGTEQRGQGAAEPGHGHLAQDQPQAREPEQHGVDDPAPPRGGPEPAERERQRDRTEKEQGEARHQCVAQRDDHPRRQRQRGSQAREQVVEGRDDLPQNDADDYGGNPHDRDRVGHGRLDLRPELDVLLDVRRQPLQNRVEDAARLTRRDHVGKEGIENPRMLPHRIGEARTGFDRGPCPQDGLPERPVHFLLPQGLETLHQRHARIDHHRELAREDRQVSRGHRLAPVRFRAALAALLHQLDPGDEDLFAAQGGDRRLARSGNAFTAHAPAGSGPSRIAKGRHHSAPRPLCPRIGFEPIVPDREMSIRSSSGIDDAAIAVSAEMLPRPTSDASDWLVSRPGESHPRALAELYVNVSAHTAPIIQPPASLNGFAWLDGSSRTRG